MLTEEELLPYDRPLLSKNLKGSADNFLLKQADFYTEYEIDVRLGSKVVGVDAQEKEV